MNPKIKTHVAASLFAMLLLPNMAVAEDMGLMRVDSTTIDDRFESKRGEPSNISVISGNKVEKAHAENIKQILDAIPGVTAELQSQDSLKIHIRGVENQRFMGEKPGVAVVIDGVPVFERTGRVNINMDDIESIKVVKGGASYLFGDDALAGAVIITTKRGAKLAGGQISAEGGSFGSKRGLARAGFATDKVSGHLQVSRREADSYYFQGQYKADYLNGKLQGYLSDSSDLTFGWEVAKRFKDSHGTVTGVTQAAVDPTSVNGRDFARHYNVDLGKFYLTYANDISETSNLMLNIYQFGDHTKFWSSPIRYSTTGAVVTDVNAYANGNDYKQVQRGIKGEWRGSSESLGWMGAVDLRDNSYKNKVTILQSHRASPSPFSGVTAGTVITDDKTKERMYAGYGELKYRLTKDMTMTMNGRYDHVKLTYDSYLPAAGPQLAKHFNVGSYRGGINYDFSDSVSLYSNVSTGFRAPTVQQLFAGSAGLTGNVAANPNLKTERAINYEVGLRGRLDIVGGLEWDVAAFQIDRKDFILNVAGQYANPATGVTDQYQNIGGMRNRGVELAVKSDQQQLFSMDLAYTLLDAKFTRYDNYNLLLGNRFSPAPGASRIVTYNNSGKTVPRAPKHKVFLAARVKPFAGFTLTGEMNAQSSYFADEINQEKIGGHALFDLVANYDFTTGANNGVKWALFGRMDNVLDRTVYNTARGYYDSNGDFTYNAEDLSIVVNPGRRYTAGITATF
ncbi:TonB-dependent receptor [Mariprofundus sp. NF]|uniref:TonB-dependent receptor n=1 Tax=Mariprofundus sp. NF TaxID=2608716 RepID=UPI0019D57E25|nr:TonB-dependent receptor [Mariprofundus sp. NF]